VSGLCCEQGRLRPPLHFCRGFSCGLEHAIEQAHRRLRRKASKKQMNTKPESLEVVKYVVVYTTHRNASAVEILEWYRTGWQIELVFKPLESLVGLGHLPKHDDRSSRAWLHGKLVARKAIVYSRSRVSSRCKSDSM
jgi:hypothetical protein